MRDIAGDHGISEGAIRAKAKKNGWMRDAAGLVRRKINDHIAGITQNGTQNTMRKIMDDSARAGIADMEMGLSSSRRVLGCVADMLESADNPRDLKTLNEANAGAIETIRRIRQLDEPALT